MVGPLAVDEEEGVEIPPDDEPSEITYLQALNPEALAAVQEHASWMKWLSSNTAGTTYFGNACEHCEVLQGEHFLSEPGGPFFPTDEEGVRAISTTWFELPLQAQAGGQSMGVVWMRSAPVKKPRKPRASKRPKAGPR